MVNFFSKGKWQRALASALGCAALALVAFQLGYMTLALVLMVLACLDLGMTYLRLRKGATAATDGAEADDGPVEIEIAQSKDVAEDNVEEDTAEPARKTRSLRLPAGLSGLTGLLSRFKRNNEAEAVADIAAEISPTEEVPPVEAATPPEETAQQDDGKPARKPKMPSLGAIKLPAFGISLMKDGGATKLASDDPFERFANRLAEQKAALNGEN